MINLHDKVMIERTAKKSKIREEVDVFMILLRNIIQQLNVEIMSNCDPFIIL